METTSTNQTQGSSSTSLQMLPNSTAILVLGILSIPLCTCYGLPGLALGIIALVLASKADKLYKANPSGYTEGSYKNMKAGRVCAIIGTCISGLIFLILIVYIAFLGAAFGTLFSTMPWDQLKHL